MTLWPPRACIHMYAHNPCESILTWAHAYICTYHIHTTYMHSCYIRTHKVHTERRLHCSNQISAGSKETWFRYLLIACPLLWILERCFTCSMELHRHAQSDQNGYRFCTTVVNNDHPTHTLNTYKINSRGDRKIRQGGGHSDQNVFYTCVRLSEKECNKSKKKLVGIKRQLLKE